MEWALAAELLISVRRKKVLYKLVKSCNQVTCLEVLL